MKHQAKKRFGQNFLIDQSIIAKIINAGDFKHNDFVFEIGPGLTALTKPLLSLLSELNVVEIDNDVIPVLNELKETSKNHLNIYHQDALKTDFNDLFSKHNQKAKIIGNLPYNISTPLLIKLIQLTDQINSMIFMLQKEVIDRICATENQKAYGRLSVIIQYFCNVQRVVIAPPSAFRPQPKVTSEVIKLTPKENRLALIDFKLFETVVREAFQQRRKTISNSLKKLISQEELKNLAIDPKLRAENLNLNNYVEISNYLAKT